MYFRFVNINQMISIKQQYYCFSSRASTLVQQAPGRIRVKSKKKKQPQNTEDSIQYIIAFFFFFSQVGTPGRMHALASTGALRLDSSVLLVLDMEKNIKGRNVLDMDGVANDTMALLAEHVWPHLASSSMKPGGGRVEGKGATAGQLRIALY